MTERLLICVFLVFLATFVCPSRSAAEGLRTLIFPPALEKEFPDASSTQCLVVLVDDPAKSEAQVAAFEKTDGKWHSCLSPIPANIGRAGLAAPGAKREGDGKSPSGVFRLGLVFGYDLLIRSKMPYRQTTSDDIWVDDPKSPDYNTWISRKTNTAASFEEMKRKDELYKLGMVVEYNTKPIVKGWGSAIFFHLWSGPGKSTSGCVAVAEPDMLTLLEWLDPAKRPCIALLESGQK